MTDHTAAPTNRPEVLAPAGDLDALRAALSAGADAVYFGLAEGFNARARTAGISLAALDDVVQEIHRAGARAYLTLNTLVFDDELPQVETLLRAIAASGADAVIVQDPAVALLARKLCPALECHASTQMTLSCPDGLRFAERLGCCRAVVPRELSLKDIAKLREQSPLALEVFVHGALCISWSGQCLASEVGGGRSANRGACAQLCRLPCAALVDGVRVDAGGDYLLSPLDLAAYPSVPALAALGVHSLKIEGRLKGPSYVGATVALYRAAVDQGAPLPAQVDAAAVAFSRGFTPGLLGGVDPRRLVVGESPGHRGLLLGRVESVTGQQVVVSLARDVTGLLKPGVGVVFDQNNPEGEEPGGPVFEVALHGRRATLGFGRPGPDLSTVRRGERLWLTSDPEITRAGRRLVESRPEGRLPAHLSVSGAKGEPLVATLSCLGHAVSASTEEHLSPAEGLGLGETVLRAKLGALGGTAFRLASLTSTLPPGLHLPVSALKTLRRALVEPLLAAVLKVERTVDPKPALSALFNAHPLPPRSPAPTRLVALCRTLAQVEAALPWVDELELDFMVGAELKTAAAQVRTAGKGLILATPRVRTPKEPALPPYFLSIAPDGVLVRHWAALMVLAEAHPHLTLHGDRNLNVSNTLTARYLLNHGLRTVSVPREPASLAALPTAYQTVVLRDWPPAFHLTHCLHARLLGQGPDRATCGRPCERHRLEVEDRGGRRHPVKTDLACRTTIFSGQVRTLPTESVATAGYARARVELLDEDGPTTAALLKEARLALK